MRLVFAGTPSAAVPSLERLNAAHEVQLVITRPDAPTGRRRIPTPSPVSLRARELGLPVLPAARLDAAASAAIGAVRPDLGVVVAFGGLVPAELLRLPTHGWINLHFSLLPRWRGAAPVQHGMIAGDSVTGATVFRLVPELDAGDVYAAVQRPIPADATAGDVIADLAVVGADLLAEVVDAIARGAARAEPQSGEITLAPKLTSDDARIRWDQDANTVLARIRGVTPEPGAYTTVGGTRLKILQATMSSAEPLPPRRLIPADGGVLAGTATSPVLLQRVQPAGRDPMSAADWWRGIRSAEPVAAE